MVTLPRSGPASRRESRLEVEEMLATSERLQEAGQGGGRKTERKRDPSTGGANALR